MKVGIFSDTYYPQVNGVSTSIITLKSNLEKMGHEVFIFTTSDGETQEETNVYRLPSIPFVSEHRLAMFYQPRLKKLIKTLKLDLVHTHTEFSLGIFGRMVAKELNIPHVHTYHTIYEDYTHYIVKFPKLNPLAKKTARKISSKYCNSTDKLIVPTEKVRGLLTSYGVKKDMDVVATGIELDKFDPSNYRPKVIQEIRTSLGVKSDDKVILYVGRVSKEKNICELLKNLQSFLQGNKQLKFVLIGDGPVKKDLEMLAVNLGIANQVIFAGERPWDSIGHYYQIGDVFVSASQSETQGITYIEALAAGLPVVAKADPCLKGVVENGVNGYTFRNDEDFIRGLAKIISCEEHQEDLSANALRLVEKFSAHFFAKQVENTYASVYRSYRFSDNFHTKMII